MKNIKTSICLMGINQEIIKITSDGEFFVNGKLIQKDEEIFLLFKEFLKKNSNVSELKDL